MGASRVCSKENNNNIILVYPGSTACSIPHRRCRCSPGDLYAIRAADTADCCFARAMPVAAVYVRLGQCLHLFLHDNLRENVFSRFYFAHFP